MKAILFRLNYGLKQTLGNLLIYNGLDLIYSCKTLELPWKNNEKNISCIPVGTYEIVEIPSRFYVKNVSGRSDICIHAGNFCTEIKGCILVGDSFIDFSLDNTKDIANSRKTMNELIKILPGRFEMVVRGVM